MVQTGCASVEQALLSAQQHTEAVNKLFGTNLLMCNFSASNIVCKVDTQMPIDLMVLKKLLGSRCTYEDPEYSRKVLGKKQYSGAVVVSKLRRQNDDNPPKMTIFAPGNAVFMGCRNRMEIVAMIDELLGYLDLVIKHMSAVVPSSHRPVRASQFFAEIKLEEEDDDSILYGASHVR